MPRTRRRIGAVLTILLALAVVAPVAVLAAGGTFTDDDSSVFEPDIEWMAANGITAGCNPPKNDNYCPNDNVTRGQMAAFLKRLATKNVVNAGNAVTLADQPASNYETPIWATVSTSAIAGTLVSAGTVWADIIVDLPADGYLLITGMGTVRDLTDNNQTLWWIQLDTPTCSTVSSVVDAIAFGYASVASGGLRQTVTISGGVPVAAGTHTVALCASASASEATEVWATTMTAMFTVSGVVPAP